jgi:type IV fimbrial biogenesis protein FimT
MPRSRHPKTTRNNFTQGGFTAIELMVAVTILAILAALAVPSFTPLIERWRMRQITEELQSTLYYARAEAIKRGGNISIVRTLGDSGCSDISSSPALWDCGWQVLITTPGTNTTTNLQRASAPSRTHIQLRDGQGRAIDTGTPINIDRWGQISLGTSSSFDFLISPANSSSTDTAKLCVSAGGRIRRLNIGSDSCN